MFFCLLFRLFLSLIQDFLYLNASDNAKVNGHYAVFLHTPPPFFAADSSLFFSPTAFPLLSLLLYKLFPPIFRTLFLYIKHFIIMKHIMSALFFAVISFTAVLADEVPAIQAIYISPDSPAYSQAISNIGHIEFRHIENSNHAVIVFKDNSVPDEDLGAISAIRTINFTSITPDDVPTNQASPVHPDISVKAFPNPATSSLHINGMPEGLTARLFNSSGLLVLSSSTPDLIVSGLQSGIYFLQVGSQIIKIVKP